MDQNKTILIVLGSVGALCLCGAAALAALGAGFYSFAGDADSAPAQATIAPEKIPTRLPAVTPTASSGSAEPSGMPDNMPEGAATASLDDLARISALPFSYSDDSDETEEGVTIDIAYYNAAEEVINFQGTPVEITLEFYGFPDILGSSDLANGTLVYSETVTRDHSATLEEMFSNYIRIPYETMQVDPQQYFRFGSLRAIVVAPNGTFEDVSMLVNLYPEQ